MLPMGIGGVQCTTVPYVLSLYAHHVIAELMHRVSSQLQNILSVGELLGEVTHGAVNSEREGCEFCLHVARLEVGGHVLGWRKVGGGGLGRRVEGGAWEQELRTDALAMIECPHGNIGQHLIFVWVR